MDSYCATSDVKPHGAGHQPSPSVGLVPDALPDYQKPQASRSIEGVSTENVPGDNTLSTHSAAKDKHVCWYALRTTYGRERKAYEYFVAHGIEAFHPTLRRVKLIDGKRVTIEESRIPNMFFARGTEEQLKALVYDNVHLPYLRFYYRHTHEGGKLVRTPLIVPDNQIKSLEIICRSDAEDIIASTESIERFEQGQTVRIIGGKFEGVVGKVARYHGQQRVAVIIEGLLMVCTAYVPSGFLEKTQT